jgi:5'-3' exonuclease
MIPLLDGDILPYEIGFAAEWDKDRPTPGFDLVREMLINKIEEICEAVGASGPPVIYLSGKNNFREDIATKKGYKAQRPKDKPFHFENIRAYLIYVYNATVVDGYEADDALAMAQTEDTVICSRDKDLRQVPGWHYSWECGAQGELPLYKVDELGEFWTAKLPKELKGTGYKFFAAQCLLGDGVDNIPGLPGCGPVKVHDLLHDATSIQDLDNRVFSAFYEYYEEIAEDVYDLLEPDVELDQFILDYVHRELEEQAQLVWMVRELGEGGKPVMWKVTDATT